MENQNHTSIEIPTGDEKKDIKARENIIMSFYAAWNKTHPDRRVFNEDLNDFIYITYLSMDETRRHAAKRQLSTLAVLQLELVLKTAKRVGKSVPTKEGSKNQKGFSKMIRMECYLEKIGAVKLLVGIKKKTGEKIQYCVTALQQYP